MYSPHPRKTKRIYYAAPLPQPGFSKEYPTGGYYTLQCTCEAPNGSNWAAGSYQVQQCPSNPAAQCATMGNGASKCHSGYTEKGQCSKTHTSWADNLYSTNIPHKPSFYTWNNYLGFVGYPAGLDRNIYGDGVHAPEYD